MRKKSKLFLCLISSITLIAAIPNTGSAGDLSPDKDSQKEEKKSGGMKSWAPSAPKESKEKAPAASGKSIDEADLTEEEREILKDMEERLKKDKENEGKDDKSLTPEEKLWKKYNDLAKKHAKEEKEKKEEKEDEDKSPKTDEKSDNDDKNAKDSSDEDAQDKEKAEEDDEGGLKGILKRYKESQQNKGEMNSRSFGNID